MSRRAKWLVVGVVALLILGLPSAALGVKVRNDRVAEEKASAAAEAKAAADAEAQAEADRKQEEAEAEQAAKDAADTEERNYRKSIIRQMQKSITKDAKKDVESGYLEGPIYYTTCDPLGGGSADDLTAITTTFSCMAVNEKLKGDMVRGYSYSATANWDEGSWTWHLGD